MCLKAFRLECERDARGTVNVEAHEVHTVIGEDDSFSESYINPDEGFFRRDPLSYERRRIYERSSFQIPPPRQRLKAVETETDAKIIHVSDEPLEPKRFPPMKSTPGEGFRETNATEVIFGVDPSHGCPRPWVTPVAFRLIKVGVVRGGTCAGVACTSDLFPGCFVTYTQLGDESVPQNEVINLYGAECRSVLIVWAVFDIPRVGVPR